MTAGLECQLREQLDRALRRTRDRQRAVLLSLSLPIAPPGDVLALLATPASHSFFWQRPTDEIAVAGVGAAVILSAQGTDRFAALAAACDDVIRTAVIDADGDALGAGPIFVGGFAFAPHPTVDGIWSGFPPAQLVVPRCSVVRHGQTATLTFNVMVDGRSELAGVVRPLVADLMRLQRSMVPHPTSHDGDSASPRYEAAAQSLPQWRHAVAATVADIAAGRIEKLVLARTCTVESARAFDVLRVVRRLRRAYPDCTTFCIGTPQGHFLGATPERLVHLDGETVCTAAVAGTMARGSSPGSDQMLARALQDSCKDRHEHAVVVRGITAALAPLCTRLDVPAEPRLFQLDNVHHLITPIIGTLRRPTRILDVVSCLHPSPAVAGYPRAAAIELLRQREEFERGWYAGAVGWLDTRNRGEFAVALRAALIRGASASLFAGAGIVAGSDPDTELAETRLKLQPVLSALLEL